MKFDFTNGKWEIEVAEGYETRSDEIMCGEKFICCCQSDPFDKEAQANARLISKAPEMLKALIEIQKAFINIYKVDTFDTKQNFKQNLELQGFSNISLIITIKEIISIIQPIIEKATGKKWEEICENL